MNEEMRKRIRRAVWETWQAIGNDIEQAAGESHVELNDEMLVEVVLDADHVRSYGNDAEAAKELYAMDHDAMMQIAIEALCG